MHTNNDGSYSIEFNGKPYIISEQDYKHCVGEGTFGKVYRASCEGLQYAIKIMRKDKIDMINLSRELEIMNTIAQDVKGKNDEHYHLIYSVGVKDDDQNVYLAMPFLDGGDLKSYLDSKYKDKIYIKEDEAIKIIRQILIGLQYLHKKNIIHRDLKPANFFLKKIQTDEYFPYVLYIGDFGISKAKTTEEQTSMVGTPLTMAPEVNTNNYNLQFDVYSIGCVIFKLMNNYFPSQSRFVGNVMKSVDSIEVINPQISQFMMYVMEGCLQLKPENRFKSEELFKLFNVSMENESIPLQFKYIPYDTPDKDAKLSITSFTRRRLMEPEFLKSKLLTYYMEIGNSNPINELLKDIINNSVKKQQSQDALTPINKSKDNQRDKPVAVSSMKLSIESIDNSGSNILLISPPYKAIDLYNTITIDHTYSTLRLLAKDILNHNVQCCHDISNTINRNDENQIRMH